MKKLNTLTTFTNDRMERLIIETFINNVVDYLILTGDSITFPQMLGTFRIFKYNTDKLQKNTNTKIFDYKLTKELKDKGHNTMVKMTNRATLGYWWTFKWYKSNNNNNLRSKTLWSCDLVRGVRRSTSYNKKRHLSVTDYFRTKGWEIYAELPTRKHYLHKL